LIFKDDLFEMLALCWGIGHRSWIHNHRGQHCWMTVTEGTLAVRNYARLGCDQRERTVRLKPVSEFLIYDGSSAAVDPTEPVHLVSNPEEFEQPAVSLHIYSRPYDSCVVYDVDLGLCRDATMFYTSEYGVRTDRHKGGGTLTELPACACELNLGEQEIHCGAVPVRVAIG
jgi:cysteine dioxygenase